MHEASAADPPRFVCVHRLRDQPGALLGLAHVAQAATQVGGEFGFGVEAEPGGLVVASGAFVASFGAAHGRAGGVTVAKKCVPTCLDGVQQRGQDRSGLAVGHAVTGAGERDGLAGVAQPIVVGGRAVADLDSHAAHMGQDVGGVEPIARAHGEVEGLDVVALGQRVAADVGCHRPSQPGGLGDRAEQGLSGLLRVAAVHDCAGPAVQQLHHLFADTARSIPVIEPLQMRDALGDDLHIGHPDAPASHPRGVLGGRHRECEQRRFREGRNGEHGAQQELASIHIPSRQLRHRADCAVQCA